MKRYLLLIAVLLLSQLKNFSSAQKLTVSPDSLFLAPDTVCINQLVTLLPDTAAFHAHSYYWGFCSGYLSNAPVGTNLGNNFKFHIPDNIDIVNDSGNFYGFVVNSQTTEFIRLNFGNSLTNIPTITNFGNITKGLPLNPTSLYILKDTLSRNWFIFVTGGFDAATSSIARIDFGKHLSNPKPNIANFGNYNGLLDYPKGIFVAQDASNLWFGYVINHNTNELFRLDFSYNVSITPRIFNYGNVPEAVSSRPLLNNPTDLAAVYEKGKWYLFITNEGLTSWVSRIDLTNRLDPDPTVISGERIRDNDLTHTGLTAETFNFMIDHPSSISINRDCGNLYAYITDSTTNQLIGIQMQSATGDALGHYYGVDYNNKGSMNKPSGISSILRSGDNLYGFVVNPADSTLTRLDFDQCKNSSIPSYSEVKPPTYSYDTAGVYNVYLVIDQGLPTQRVDCKPITVLNYPVLYRSHDTTICAGDTIKLWVVSSGADSLRWMTGYNLDTSYLFVDSAKAYPDYSFRYPVNVYYGNGCIVDTAIRVRVKKVKADAGPDRWVHDGAITTIGGPYTTLNNSFRYHWEPFNFLSDSTVPNPYAFPPYDYTYYLTVTDNSDGITCSDIDTVVVRMDCGDFYLPNAFAPNSSSTAVNRFTILNKEIIKLSYFRVYDRWGVLVFETTDPTQGWDGTFNNKPEPMGVYVWEADGFCVFGKHVKKHGNVSLLR